MSRARALALCAAALTTSALLLALPASAHAPDPTRTVRGSGRAAPSGEVELDLLVDQRLPRGAARLQRARFDVDRDGRLSDAEARLLGAEVAPLVLRGIVLQQGAAPLVPRSQEATARVEGRDLVRVAVLLRFSVASPPTEALSLAITPDAASGLEPVRVSLAPLGAEPASHTPEVLVRPGDPPTPWPVAPRQR